MLLTTHRLFRINKLRDFKNLSSSWFESMLGSQISSSSPEPGFSFSLLWLTEFECAKTALQNGSLSVISNFPAFQVARCTSADTSARCCCDAWSANVPQASLKDRHDLHRLGGRPQRRGLDPVMSENQIRLRLLALPLASQPGVTQRNVARNRLLTLAKRHSHSAL